MSGPVFDEDNIVALLTCDPKIENIGRIQAGAMQTLVDLFDRKVTRGEFINMASACVALYGQAAKMYMLGSIHNVFAEEALNENAFSQAHDGMGELMSKQMAEVLAIVDRLKLCPNDTDKVH